MELLTKGIQSKLDKVKKDNPDDGIGEKAICRFFNPITNGVWIVFGQTIDDPDILWVVADLGIPDPVAKGRNIIEFGTVRLSELRDMKLPYGLRIERDIMFGEGKSIEYFMNQKTLHK